MVDRPIRIRRGRRTDFVAVMELLARARTMVPAPDRATLRRFRQLVADLGGDLYLAVVDERVVGLAHVTYARQLARGPLATLGTLIVGESSRDRVGTALLDFALMRARKRACAGFRYAVVDAEAGRGADLLRDAGGRPVGSLLEVPLAAEE